MKYKQWNELQISAFSLGTVQLGMAYGISNTTGKPDFEQALQMLNRAMELGVTHLDTSNDYGNSEQVIGQWLHSSCRTRHPLITTKVGHLSFACESQLEQQIRKQVEDSLNRLHLSQLPILMLHYYEEYAQQPQWMQRIFRRLKEEKLIVHSGISAYSHHDYRVIADSGFDAVQIPLNLFDWRRITDGSLDRLAQAGMAVFVRSAFLQGLVFLKSDQLEPQMSFCKPALSHFRELCDAFGMRPEELAVSFLLTLPQVTGLVLGCDTVAQVESNAALMDRAKALTNTQMETIRAAFEDRDPRVINPGCWQKP